MAGVLILGIGNALMGDEGVGVHVARCLAEQTLPRGVECLDGGTGGFHLLEPMQDSDRIVLIDATVDGAAPGTVRRLQPKFSRDYPRTLTAHDIGLKDLLDAFHLSDRTPDVTLYAVSIDVPPDLATELTPEVAAVVPGLAARIIEELSSNPK